MNLEEEGTLLHLEGNGNSRIHKRRLNRSSEEEYQAASLPTPPVSSPPQLEEFTTIPDQLFSKEALLYVGFTDAATDVIWNRWMNWQALDGWGIDETETIAFDTLFKDYVNNRDCDAWSEQDSEWEKVLTDFGINDSLKEAIMTPQYKDVRLTKSCKDWTLDSLSARYATLQDIQETSTERARSARRAGLRPEARLPGQQTAETSRSVSGLLSSAPGVSPFTSSAPQACSTIPNHTVLFHGGYLSRLKRIFNEQGQVNNFLWMQHSPPRDFTVSKMAIYLAVDFEVARRWAAYAKRRDSDGVPVICRLEIPNSALESLTTEQKLLAYFPSPIWSRLVWTCRRNERLRHDLAPFARATLIIGSVCRKPDAVIANLSSSTDITSNMVLENPRGGNAVQYAFVDDHGLDFLECHVAEHCTLHRMTSSEARAIEESSH